MRMAKGVFLGKVSRMTKQGRRFRQRSLVVVGNGFGAAGFGVGKSNTGREALVDAKRNALKDIVTTPVTADRTLFHDLVGSFNNTKVVIRPGNPINGIVAGPAVQSILKCFGFRTASSKVIGKSSTYTVVNATFNALSKHETPAQNAMRRGQRIPFN